MTSEIGPQIPAQRAGEAEAATVPSPRRGDQLVEQADDPYSEHESPPLSETDAAVDVVEASEVAEELAGPPPGQDDEDAESEDAESEGADEPSAPGGFDLTPDEVPGGRSWRGFVAVIVVVALTIGGLLWWRLGQPEPATPAPPAAAPQHSLFIAVATPDNHLVNGLYYATGEAPTGLFIPGTLMSDVPTLGRAPLSDTLLTGPDLPGAVFTDVTGLKTELSWAVPMDAMAALIDKVGGVTVDVDVPVSANGVDLKPGRQQQLTGDQAMTFATWTASGEPQSSQAARMSQVVTTLLAALPADTAGVEALLAGVPGSTTATPGALAGRLVEVRDDLHSQAYVGSLLPVTAAATPEVPGAVVLDRERLSTLVDGRLGSLRLFTPGSAGAVHLQNASGVAELDLSARRQLIDLGFDYTYRGVAEPVQQATIVMVPTEADLPAGRRVAKDLGLPEAYVVASPIVPSSVDAFILLGADFAASRADGDASATDAAPEGEASAGDEPGESAASETAAPAETTTP